MRPRPEGAGKNGAFLTVVVRPPHPEDRSTSSISWTLEVRKITRHRFFFVFLAHALEEESSRPIRGILDIEHGHVRELLVESVQRGLPVLICFRTPKPSASSVIRHRGQKFLFVRSTNCDPRHYCFFNLLSLPGV